MSINWSTFGLELLNFLILIWILQRLLYRPVLEAIERRRLADAAAQEAACKLHAEAEELQRTYAARLADWECERQGLQSRLEAEMDRRRAEARAQLEQDLERQKADRAAQELQERRAEAARLESQAVRTGGEFVAKLLHRLAAPELQERLIAVLIEDLPRLPQAQREALRHEPLGGVELASAFPLPASQQAELGRVLGELAAQAPVLHCVVDPSLVAGVRIQAGPLTLSANLAEELAAFCEAGGGSA